MVAVKMQQWFSFRRRVPLGVLGGIAGRAGKVLINEFFQLLVNVGMVRLVFCIFVL